MIFIDAAQTKAMLDFGTLIPALRQMFISGCTVPLRHNHAIGPAGAPVGTLLLMPAWRNNGYLGVKTVNIFPGNVQVGLPGLHSTYMLYDAATGAPLAQIDGNEITSRRTPAASALAASYMAREDAQTLLVVGAGRVGSLLAHAYREVRPIRQVLVWDINEALCAALVQQLRSAGLEAEQASSLEGAARAADIISCATLSTKPLISGAWLKPGTHLDLTGSFTPDMREADDACFQSTRVFVDTAEAYMKSGDLLSPLQSGVLRQEDIQGTLADLCNSVCAGRVSTSEITVFKAVGTALEDLAAAGLVYERVHAAGAGANPVKPGRQGTLS